MAAAIPPMDPRPMRTMRDMGMGAMEQGSMSGMNMNMNQPGTSNDAVRAGARDVA
jgi:hypothetical protein